MLRLAEGSCPYCNRLVKRSLNLQSGFAACAAPLRLYFLLCASA